LFEHVSQCSNCLSVLAEVVSMCLDEGGCGHTAGHKAG